MSAESVERLSRLGSYAAIFTAPGFSVGAWAGGERISDKEMTVPYFAYSDVVEQFITEMAGLGWVYPFDWQQWTRTPRAQLLLHDPSEIAAASAEELAKIVTTAVRGERFSDGEIAAAFESGVMLAVARRAEALASAPEE